MWDPQDPLRIEIGQEAAEPNKTRNRPRKDRNGKQDGGLRNCECCCRAPIATLVVFLVLLVILLAVVARSYAVYTRELAASGGSGEGEIPGQVGAPGGSPGQYTHGSGDSSHVCEVTPQLTCTCDGTPIIQVRTDERSFSSGTQWSPLLSCGTAMLFGWVLTNAGMISSLSLPPSLSPPPPPLSLALALSVLLGWLWRHDDAMVWRAPGIAC